MKDNLSKEVIQLKLKILFISIFLGILNYNFITAYKGIWYPFFIAVLIIVFVFNIGIKNKSKLGYFFLCIGFILSISFAIYSNPIFRALNTLLIPLTIISSFILLTYDNIEFKFGSFVSILLNRIFKESLLNSLDIPFITKNLFKKGDIKDASNKFISILIGLLLAIPILIVLSQILCGADGIFAYYLSNLSFDINNRFFNDILPRVILSILFTIFIFGLYSSFTCELKRKEAGENNIFKFNSITIITLLCLISALYIIFTKIQVTYLYGGRVLPEGFNYAEYAREGFFQLVFIVFINVISIVFIKSNTKIKTPVGNRILLGIYSLITLLTFNMMISALYKMKLYTEAFGFTRLRILVTVFTIFLGIILILLLLFIWKKINIFKPTIVLGCIMYVFINFLNLDAFIVKNNVNLYTSSAKIDLNYLTMLSADCYNEIGKAHRMGLISEKEYKEWKGLNKIKITHWYEYNYFTNKLNKK